MPAATTLTTSLFSLLTAGMALLVAWNVLGLGLRINIIVVAMLASHLLLFRQLRGATDV